MQPDVPSLEQQALLDLLRAGHPGKRAPSWKRSKHEFVLEYGYWYDPLPLPDDIEQGTLQECFTNAFNLALDNKSLIYCEGFVLSRTKETLIHHAWVTDGTGRAIDNTLVPPATAYAGVPFITDFTNRYHLRNRAIICLLDDYEHDWPLLGELGDKPQEWLDLKGRGITKLT